MKSKKDKLMSHLNKELKVIEFNDTEYTLNNGEIYQHQFKIENNITLEEFQEILNESRKIITNIINGNK